MRLAFTLLHGLAVDVHGCSNVGVAHQFLLHLDRSPSLVEKTPEGVSECVPTDAAYARSVQLRGRYVVAALSMVARASFLP